MGARHTRRQFVRRGGAAALVVAGAPALLADAAWPATTADLRRRLRGSLITPRDAGWAAARALFNPRLRVEPRAIAFCETTADVAQVVRFARTRGWPVAGRGGRHSFGGYCNAPGGIVADVSRIDAVTLERGRPVARIGGGASVLDVYRDLVLEHRRALPVGTCPTVGIAGLTLGGGFGRLMRRYGISADSLRAATVVLADGRVVRCSDDSRADLLWALRGGGAGFGIVTQMRFAIRPAPADPIAFTLSYPWAQAPAAIDAWQRTLPAASATLSYGRLRALRRPNGALTLTASGHWYGSEPTLRNLLAPLVAAGPARQTLRRRTFAQAALPDSVRLQEGGPVIIDSPRFPNYQRSDFFDALLPPQAIAALVAQIERWPGVGGSGNEGRRPARRAWGRRQPAGARRQRLRPPPAALPLRAERSVGESVEISREEAFKTLANSGSMMSSRRSVMPGSWAVGSRTAQISPSPLESPVRVRCPIDGSTSAKSRRT